MSRKQNGRSAHTKIWLVMAGYGIVFLGFNLNYLVRNPLPWPDEAVYADIASNYLHKHRLGTNLWQGMIPGVEKLAGWNPPGYFLATVVMFKLFGETLWSQRLLSTLTGLLIGCLILDGLRRLKPKLPAIQMGLIALAWLIDYQWLTGVRLARPEMMVLLPGMLTLWMLVRIYQEKQPVSWRKSFLMGLVSGSAGLVHPMGFAMIGIGVAYWVVIKKFKQLNISLGSFLIGCIVPFGIWLFWSRSDWPLIWLQLVLASKRKLIDIPWIVLVFQSDAIWGKLIYIFEGAILVWLGIKTFQDKKDVIGWWLWLVAVGMSFIAVWGRMMWYMVFALPLLYLGVGYWLTTNKQNNRFAWLLLVGMTVANSQLMLHNLQTSSLTNNGYAYFCQAVLSLIPDKTQVFLSSVPDAYYCFAGGKRANQLAEFPVLSTPKENYLHVLQNTDFVIFDKTYDNQLFGNLLTNYLVANSETYQAIEVEGTAAQVQVIKLKPRDKRSNPV